MSKEPVYKELYGQWAAVTSILRVVSGLVDQPYDINECVHPVQFLIPDRRTRIVIPEIQRDVTAPPIAMDIMHQDLDRIEFDENSGAPTLKTVPDFGTMYVHCISDRSGYDKADISEGQQRTVRVTIVLINIWHHVKNEKNCEAIAKFINDVLWIYVEGEKVSRVKFEEKVKQATLETMLEFSADDIQRMLSEDNTEEYNSAMLEMYIRENEIWEHKMSKCHDAQAVATQMIDRLSWTCINLVNSNIDEARTFAETNSPKRQEFTPMERLFTQLLPVDDDECRHEFCGIKEHIWKLLKWNNLKCSSKSREKNKPKYDNSFLEMCAILLWCQNRPSDIDVDLANSFGIAISENDKRVTINTKNSVQMICLWAYTQCEKNHNTHPDLNYWYMNVIEKMEKYAQAYAYMKDRCLDVSPLVRQQTYSIGRDFDDVLADLLCIVNLLRGKSGTYGLIGIDPLLVAVLSSVDVHSSNTQKKEALSCIANIADAYLRSSACPVKGLDIQESSTMVEDAFNQNYAAINQKLKSLQTATEKNRSKSKARTLPTDDYYQTCLRSSHLTEKASGKMVAKTIYALMALKMQNSLHARDAISFTLEHILPQSSKYGERLWNNGDMSFGSKDYEEKFQIEANMLYRLGNATILEKCANSSIKDFAYREKQKTYKKDGLALNRDIADSSKTPVWSRETILLHEEEAIKFALSNPFFSRTKKLLEKIAD